MSAVEWLFLRIGKILLYWVKNFLITERFSASVLLSLAHLCLWLYCKCVCVCVGSRACLQLFTYDGFSTQDDPPALSLRPYVALAQPNFLSRPLFPFTSLFRLFSPHVCLPFMPQTFHPLMQHHHHHHQTSPIVIPPSFTSLPILRYPISTLAWQLMGVSLLFFSHPPSILQTPLHHHSSHHTIFSHVRETCRHLLLLIIAFTGNPHRLALPWGGKERQRVKEWKVEQRKVMSSLADMCSQAAAACRGEQRWHMQLSATTSK